LLSSQIIKLFINLICELIIPASCKGLFQLRPTNMQRAVRMSRRSKNSQIIIGQDPPQFVL